MCPGSAIPEACPLQGCWALQLQTQGGPAAPSGSWLCRLASTPQGQSSPRLAQVVTAHLDPLGLLEKRGSSPAPGPPSHSDPCHTGQPSNGELLSLADSWSHGAGDSDRPSLSARLQPQPKAQLLINTAPSWPCRLVFLHQPQASLRGRQTFLGQARATAWLRERVG